MYPCDQWHHKPEVAKYGSIFLFFRQIKIFEIDEMYQAFSFYRNSTISESYKIHHV
jgi:hypothetical protein